MTREDARYYLQSSGFSEEQIATIEQAFKQEPCEDVLDRVEAMTEIMIFEGNVRSDEGDIYIKVSDAVQLLRELPSVNPQEPKTGHWFVDERPESNREVICSNCEQPVFKYHKLDFDYRPKFCPNCGARMVEPQEGEVKVNDH